MEYVLVGTFADRANQEHIVPSGVACHAKRPRIVQPKAPGNSAVARICFPEEVRVLPAGAEVFKGPVGTSVDVSFVLLVTSHDNLETSFTTG